MAFFNVKAVVVKEIVVNENNKILTVLSDTHGKLFIFAFRAKSLKSEIAPSTNLYCYSDMTIEQKGNKLLLKSATVIENFFSLRKDLDALSLAGYFAEVADYFSPDGQECAEVLRLLLNSLHFLSASDKDKRIVKAVFELKLMQYAGYDPAFDRCYNCDSKEISAFSPKNKEFCCKKCIIEDEKLIRLEKPCVKAISYILSSPLSKSFSFTASDSTIHNLSVFAEKYLIYEVGKSFKTLNFYKQIKKSEENDR